MTHAETLTVRRPGYRFASTIPRHWLAGRPFWTHVMNAFTLVFPEGERYLIRVVNRAAAGLTDERLRALAADFTGQEAQHAVEHQRFLTNLRAQDYAIDGFLAGWRRFLRALESRLGLRANLAVVAATEHLAALMGDFLLRSDVLEGSPAELAALFAWHAAEEIEHRRVAHDIAVAHGMGYGLRLLALAATIPIVGAAMAVAALGLLAQDRPRRPLAVWRDAWALWIERGLLAHVLRGVAAYLRPSFDPEATSSLAIAGRWRRWALGTEG